MLLGVVAILGAIAMVYLGSPMKAHGNPSLFTRMNQTGSVTSLPTSLATTTTAWQTAGTATSTLTYNGSLGTTLVLNTLALKLYRRGASPATVTGIQFEYSSNCDGTAPDWYSPATTTAASVPTGSFVSASASQKLLWTFASTSRGGNVLVTNDDTLILPVPVYEKCVRAVLTVPAGAASSSLYAEFVGTRENN